MISDTKMLILVVLIPIVLSSISIFVFYLLMQKRFADKMCNGNRTNKKQKHIQNLSFISVFLVAWLVSFGAMYFVNDRYNSKYDILGTEYFHTRDIPLYDENGDAYYPRKDINGLVMAYENGNGVSYRIYNLYLTKGGYIVYFKKENVNRKTGLYNTVEVDGEYYYILDNPYWDRNGNLIINGNSLMKNDDTVIVSRGEQADYQKAHKAEIYEMTSAE